MKAKSKVLLGLLVALAMMVMAVPAFATTWTVGAPDKPEQEVFLGDDVTFKFDITDTAISPASDYTVKVTDTKTGTGAAVADVDITKTLGTATGNVIPVTVKIEAAKFTGAAAGDVHNFALTVTKGGTDVTGDTKAKVTFKAVPQVKLTGHDGPTTSSTEQLEKTVEKGQPILLNAVADSGQTISETKWQISKTTTKPTTAQIADVADTTNWVDLGTGTTLNTAATNDMNGKFVRCLATVDNKTVVAAATDATMKDGSDRKTVQLNVSDTHDITVTLKDTTDSSNEKAAEASYEFFENTQKAKILELTADVTGGGSDTPAYVWTKDGETTLPEGATATTSKLLFTKITDESAGTYKCTVTRGTLEKSAEVSITVKPTPTLVIEESDGEPVEYANPGEKPSAGTGDVYLKSDEVGKAYTLTANIEGLKHSYINWFDGDSTSTDIINSASNSKTLSVPAAKVVAGQKYTVKVGFETTGLTDTLDYTVEFKETAGTLTGYDFTSADGSYANATVDPTYTITLPAGENFFHAPTTADGVNVKGYADLAGTESSQYGVNIISPRLKNGSSDDTPTFHVVITDATADAPATMTIKHTAFTTQTKPVIGPLKIEVTMRQKEGASASEKITLPVTNGVGYNITVAAADGNVVIDKVGDQTPNASTKKVNYTGEPLEAALKAAEGVEGLGEISNIRYVKTNSDSKPAALTGATTTAPTDASDTDYWHVFCDVAKSDKYGAKNDVWAGYFRIDKKSLDAEPANYKNNAPYFKIAPPTNVYNGKNQEPKVTFADDVEHAGKIEKVKYMQGTTEVTPLNVGKYDVYVSTVADSADTSGITNISPTTTDVFVKVGEYEITKVEPTPELYTMKPTEVTYTGAEQGTNVTKVDEKAGDVAKVLYYAEGFDKPLEGLPVEAGKYTVKIETKENDTYAAATGDKALELGTFTITKSASDKPAIWMIGHVQDVDWGDKGSGKAVKLEAGKTAQVGTTGLGKRVEAITILVPEGYKVEGFAHIQDRDDVEVEKDENPTYIKNMDEIGSGYTAYKFGTTGQAKRIEAINIAIKTEDGKFVEGLEYATHIQNMGWLGTVRNGSFSGSRGLALRMEAVRFYYDDQIRRPTEIDKEDTKTELR